MKKDRLDELLGHALSGKDEGREISRRGLQRFRRRLTVGNEPVTVLDSLLGKAYTPVDVSMTDTVVDAGMRRVRDGLRRPIRRESPVLKPALALVSLAVIVVALLIVMPFSKTDSGKRPPIGGADQGGFASAFKTRNDIIANLPEGLTQPAQGGMQGGEITADLAKVSHRLDALDTFSSKVRGESFARRVGMNRRTILASLSTGRGGVMGEDDGDKSIETLSPTQSRREILLNEKLNRVSEGF